MEGAGVSFEGFSRSRREQSDIQPCPSCQAPGGVPFSVESALPGKIIVSYRCGTCRHEWQVSREVRAQ